MGYDYQRMTQWYRTWYVVLRGTVHSRRSMWWSGTSSLVLNFFRSGRFKQWDLLSDRDLTLKTVFLLAIATGKRRDELHALAKDVRWLSGAVRAVEISPVPEFLSKTHVKTNGLGALRQLTVSSLDGALESEDNEERLSCPGRTLEAYLSRSDQYRSPEQKRLFISYHRGTVKDISRQTISVYIKEAVVLAYSDPSQDTKSPVHVKPHSVRHVATSLSALRNFSLDDVLKAGAWSSPNVFLKHYVQNFSTDALSKLSRLGGFVAAGAVIWCLLQADAEKTEVEEVTRPRTAC